MSDKNKDFDLDDDFEEEKFTDDEENLEEVIEIEDELESIIVDDEIIENIIHLSLKWPPINYFTHNNQPETGGRGGGE
jgi:hypothetical protein